MIHPASELRFISAEIGHGVFATEFIPRGTLVWVLDEFDRVLTPPRSAGFRRLLRAGRRKYAYVRADGNIRAVLGPRPLHEPLLRPDGPRRRRVVRSGGPRYRGRRRAHV